MAKKNQKENALITNKSKAICLCGKDAYDSIMKIDWNAHPDVTIEYRTHPSIGRVTVVHTVFGEFLFKIDPSLDSVGYSHSFGIIDEKSLVHYVKCGEHGKKLENGNVALYDGLALDGTHHLWVNGDDHSQKWDGQL